MTDDITYKILREQYVTAIMRAKMAKKQPTYDFKQGQKLRILRNFYHWRTGEIVVVDYLLPEYKKIVLKDKGVRTGILYYFDEGSLWKVHK